MGKSAESQDLTDFSRRNLLRCSAAALTTAVLPQLIQANNNITSERTLDFINLHTNEKLSCCYWSNGSYEPDRLTEINYILRDHRAEEVYEMDPSLLDLLYVLREASGSQAPFHIISAYRSPKTNEKLRSNSSGVAKRSLHMQGKAIDIRLPGIELNQLRDTAVGLQAGGVGYYAKSNFLHIDIGRPRFW